MRRDPRRCLKCQAIGANHFAVGCGSQNVCGTCGKEHRTAECTEDSHAQFYCANCKATNNVSWDHACHKFMESCKRLEDSDPVIFYRFFLTNELWTWEQ